MPADPACAGVADRLPAYPCWLTKVLTLDGSMYALRVPPLTVYKPPYSLLTDAVVRYLVRKPRLLTLPSSISVE
jgi:hypothetical protein